MLAPEVPASEGLQSEGAQTDLRIGRAMPLNAGRDLLSVVKSLRRWSNGGSDVIIGGSGHKQMA